VLYVRRDRQLPRVPAPAVVDSPETQAFADRFVWTGTRDRTPYCAIQAASALRAALGGEAAIMGYNAALARWAEAHLRAKWRVPAMAPPAMFSGMSVVQIPAANASQCAAVRAGLLAAGWSMSGCNAVGDPPIACYFRLSAQVYLEQADFVALGDKVLALLGQS
jgi:isopenicillin-N epimerase